MLLEAILLPIVATIVMTGLRSLVSPPPVPWGHLTEDLAWDLCVLSLGVTGSIVANQRIRNALGSEGGAVYLTVVILLVDILFAIAILQLRRSALERLRVQLISLVIGIFAVGMPASLTFWE